MKTITIVIPVYYNELNLPDTIPQLVGLSEKLKEYRFEFIFVDDGSGDRSLEIIREYQRDYPNMIKAVKLTRNFGSMAAIQAGFTVSTGDCVGVIAADLQDPPELFVDMINHWEKGCKSVFAVRVDRDEPPIQKSLSNTYYSLIRKFAIPGYPTGGFDFLLVDRQVVNEVNKIQEKNTNLMTLIFWLGYQPVMIPYTRRHRDKGESRWTFSKKIKLFIDTFVSFSYFPVRMFSGLGILFSLVSFAYACFILYFRIRYGFSVEGWVSTMLMLIFTAGIQMVTLGVLGEYLWRTLDETRKRPPFVIDMIISAENSPEVPSSES